MEREGISFQRHLAMVRDEMSHDVALNHFVPPVNNALGMNSAFNSPRPSLPNQIEFRDDWKFLKVSIKASVLSRFLLIADN